MLLDALEGGTIRVLTEVQVKDLVKKMCLNKYRSKSERGVKVESIDTSKGRLTLDTHTALLYQFELLNKKLVKSRGVRGLGWIGFVLTHYLTRSNFNGLGPLSNTSFYCQSRSESTRSLMGWVRGLCFK